MFIIIFHCSLNVAANVSAVKTLEKCFLSQQIKNIPVSICFKLPRESEEIITKLIFYLPLAGPGERKRFEWKFLKIFRGRDNYKNIKKEFEMPERECGFWPCLRIEKESSMASYGNWSVFPAEGCRKYLKISPPASFGGAWPRPLAYSQPRRTFMLQ